MINFYNYLNCLLIPILLPLRLITFIGIHALSLCIPHSFINKYFKQNAIFNLYYIYIINIFVIGYFVVRLVGEIGRRDRLKICSFL